MPERTVVLLGDPRLRQKAKTVTRFTPELKQLAQDMLDTMRHYQGVGLAGPQIGVLLRIFVAEIPADRDNGGSPHPQSGKTYILVNPKITRAAAELVEGEEGCLSIPGWRGLVARPAWVEVRAQDLQGRRHKYRVDGLLARIFQHEMDHLDGILYIDRIAGQDKLWREEAEESVELAADTALSLSDSTR